MPEVNAYLSDIRWCRNHEDTGWMARQYLVDLEITKSVGAIACRVVESTQQAGKFFWSSVPWSYGKQLDGYADTLEEAKQAAEQACALSFYSTHPKWLVK